MATQPRVFDVSVTAPTTDRLRVSWDYDSSVAVTSFGVYKSSNKGLTYTLISTVTFAVNGANYNRVDRAFFYDDLTGAAGDIYKIVANGVNGTSASAFGIAPAVELARCLIIGYARDGFGDVDPYMDVLVETYGNRGEHWVQNSGGVIAQHAQAIGVSSGARTLHPDVNGMWSVELIQKTFARIRIPALEFDWAFEVPDKEGPVNIRDVALLRQGDYYGTSPEQVGIGMRIIQS